MIVVDAGALIAIERGDRFLLSCLQDARDGGGRAICHGGIVGQVWRGRGLQARLASALEAIDIRPLDAALGRAAGVLLARARMADVVDAALVALAGSGDQIFTSDPEDLEALVRATGRDIALVEV